MKTVFGGRRWLLVAALAAAGLGGPSLAALAASNSAGGAGSAPAPAVPPNLVALAPYEPNFPRLGSSVRLEPSVQNLGAAASNVVMTTTLFGPFAYQSLVGPGWSCTPPAAGTLSPAVPCRLPGLAASSGSGVTITVAAPASPGEAEYIVNASSAVSDSAPGDNTTTNLLVAFAHSANGNEWDLADAQTKQYALQNGALPDSGALSDAGQDAFDNFGMLRLRVADFPPVNTDIGDLGLTYSDGGHWRTTTPQALSEVRVSRRIDAPPGADWIRYIDTFTNTDGEFPVSFLVMWGGNLGSDNQTATRATSDGDHILTALDTWAVTVQEVTPGGQAVDAPVGYALRSPTDSTYQGPYVSNQTPFTSTVWTSHGNDLLGHVYKMEIAPSGSAKLAYFIYRGLAEQTSGPEDCGFYGGCVTPAVGSQAALVQAAVTALVANPPFCDLTANEISQIANWPDVVEHCVYLPAVER